MLNIIFVTKCVLVLAGWNIRCAILDVSRPEYSTALCSQEPDVGRLHGMPRRAQPGDPSSPQSHLMIAPGLLIGRDASGGCSGQGSFYRDSGERALWPSSACSLVSQARARTDVPCLWQSLPQQSLFRLISPPSKTDPLLSR